MFKYFSIAYLILYISILCAVMSLGYYLTNDSSHSYKHVIEQQSKPTYSPVSEKEDFDLDEDTYPSKVDIFVCVSNVDSMDLISTPKEKFC